MYNHNDQHLYKSWYLMVLNTFKDRKLTEISTALSNKFAEHRVNEIQKAARQVGQVTSATKTIIIA